MITRVIAWYARRVVNVNINIILAGVLALFPVLLVVHFAEYLFSSGRVHSEKLHARHHLVISAVTFLSDVIFDVSIYFILHWLANHTPHLKALRKNQLQGVANAAAENVPFFKDAAKVQLQRAVLSPLLYVLWLGTQFVAMNVYGLSAVWATVTGFCIAMGTVRSIHTFWMLKEERAQREITEGRVCGKCGYDLRAIPADVSGICPECGKEFRRPVVVAPPSATGLPGAAGSNPAGPRNGAAQSLSENGVKSVSRS